MSLDLGKISGVIGLDDSPFAATLEGTKAKLKKWGSDAAKEAEKGGEEAGKGFGSGWGKKALVALGTGAVAAAATFTAALVKGMNLEPVNDKLAASMNLTTEEAAVMSRAAGKVYASNWGESMEDAAERTGLVMSSIYELRYGTEEEISRMTGLFSAFSDGFEIDMARATQVVGQMVSNGLVEDAEAGLDMLTAVLHTIPANVREDVLDAVDEYTPYFNDLGIKAEDMMSIIAAGSQNGAIGIDKMADAVKELGIRAKDGSESTMDAYKQLGLNGKKMTADIAAGGETAQAATQKLATALLNVEDPAKRSQLSISLFGTQMEDLGVEMGDRLLSSLSGAEDAFDSTGGAAETMANRMGDNAAGNIQTFLRTIEQGATEYIGGKFLPALNDVTGKLITDWGPVIETANGHLSEFGRWVNDNASWLGPLATAVGIFGAALGALGLVGYISSLGGLGGAFLALASKIGLTTAATIAKTTAEMVASGASKALAAAQWLVNAAMAANPIGLVVLALAALVAAFVYAYQNSEDFRKIVDGALQFVKGGAEAVAKWFMNDFLGFWKGAFDGAGKTLDSWGKGVDQTNKNVNKWFADTGKGIQNWAGDVGRSMGDAARWVDSKGKDIGASVTNRFDAAKQAAIDRVTWLKDGVLGQFDRLKSGFELWGRLFQQLLSGDFSGFSKTAETIMRNMSNNLLGIFNGIKDGAKRVWELLPADLKKPIQDAVRWINNTFVGGINGMLGKLSISFRVPQISGFSEGGYTGNGGKYQPAGVVHAGEVVWSQDDVAAWGGPAAVDSMRQRRGAALPGAEGYAGGGIVANARQGFNNYNPTYLTALRSWAAATGRTFYMTGNGGARSSADQIRAWNLYQAGLGPLAARPGTSAHERGMAMDVKPWPSAQEVAMMRAFGLGLTVRGEPWHIGWTGGKVAPGSTGGGGGGGGFLGDFGVGALVSKLLGNLPFPSPWKDIASKALATIPENIGKAIMGSLGFTMGTDYAPAGIASVAENGAELVLGKQLRNFRGGESVYNAAATTRLLQGGRGDTTINVTIPVDDVLKLKDLDDFFQLLDLNSHVTEGV